MARGRPAGGAVPIRGSIDTAVESAAQRDDPRMNPSLLPLADHVAALPADWRPLGQRFLASPQGAALQAFLAERLAAGATIYPPRPLRALQLTPLSAVRAVILGQDPYHGPGQAHGLAFSVPDGLRPPPSLRNIFLELRRDCGCAPPSCGNLERWARQGVLLLNVVLTVEAGRPASHAGRGWEAFTDAAIELLARDPVPKVFLLWGAPAQCKCALIEAAGNDHAVLAANHPSPLSARRPPLPFLGCGHFSQANAFLAARGRGAIDWCGGGSAG
jgi:uracil-DNA glycosylase